MTEKSAELEVYIQRYETFRHLDSMRYQVQNITVLLGTLFAGYAVNEGGDYPPILGVVAGVILISFGITMRRITNGIVSNSKVLREFGQKIGDNNLPITSNDWRTANFWTSAITILIGIGLAVWSGMR